MILILALSEGLGVLVARPAKFADRVAPAVTHAVVSGPGTDGDDAAQATEGPLKQRILDLFAALNHRDLDAIKSQISPTRIYVEIMDKAGAYLTNSQTLAVLESFMRSHTSMNAKFEFDSADGDSGSASGMLTARRDGHTLSYRLNFGFTRNPRGAWLLTRISMR